MISNLLRRRFVSCLVIHPVLIKQTHKKVTIEDVYDAEEAIGLSESLEWKNTHGPFKDYLFSPETFFDISKVKKIEDGSLPEDLAVNEPVLLLGEKALYLGDNQFQVDLGTEKSDSQEFENTNDDYQRYSFAQSHVVKIKTGSRLFYFNRNLLQLIKKFIIKKKVKMLYINDFLSPIQLRNIRKVMLAEDKSDDSQPQSTNKFVNAIDRLGIILEIFNRRARSDITKLQVALLYVKYSKTLLASEDDYFTTVADIYNFNVTKPNELTVKIASAKQTGRRYIMAGEGESQKELQTRIMKNLEKVINERLKKTIHNQKTMREKSLKQTNLFILALIGYTNAGKSAVMNMFAKYNAVESKDQLFQTLYTVTKKVKIQGNFDVLLVDTIGFISDLPHDMVPAFASTLEHLKTADLILHIRDFSHPQSEKQDQVVKEVLKQIGIGLDTFEKKTIEVRNKIDLVEERKQVRLIIENKNSLSPVDQTTALEYNEEGGQALIDEGVKEENEEEDLSMKTSEDSPEIAPPQVEDQSDNTNNFFDFEEEISEENSERFLDFKDTEKVVHISATKNMNIKRLRSMIVSRIYKNFNCFEYEFTNDFESHHERSEWFRE